MKQAAPLGWIVLGAGLGGSAALFGPIIPANEPLSAAHESIANTNDQDDTEITIKGIGNSGNNFTFGQSNEDGHVFVHAQGIPRVSDETLASIFVAVRNEALHGNIEAARLIAEIANAQREHEELNDENDQSGDENERQ